MKEAIIMTKTEYRSLVNKINDMQIDLVHLTDLLNEARERAKRLWNEANLPAIKNLQKQHDEEYLAWCEEIAAKYEETDYLAWCEETAKKYDDLHWCDKWHCDPEDLKWIAWAKQYSKEAISEEEQVFNDWKLVCELHVGVNHEKRMAYKALYTYYYFYGYKAECEWFWDQYKWWLSI